MAEFPESLLKLRPAPRILVVNDDRDVVFFIAAMLEEEERFAFNFAYDGAAALRLARIILPDLIVLNQLMPRLCGLEVLAKLRAAHRTRHIKVIIHSAYPMEEMALDAGAESFLKVPFARSELLRRVDQALERR